MWFVALLGLAWIARARGTLFEQRWLLRAFVPTVVLAYLANEAGWVAAEVGRQPWVVYGLLRTRDAVSPNVEGEHVLASIVMFSIVYVGLAAVWLFVMNEKIQHGPEDLHPEGPEPGPLSPAPTHEPPAEPTASAARVAEGGAR
jgi:cytochrome d ubiquinol oxidase subunit I